MDQPPPFKGLTPTQDDVGSALGMEARTVLKAIRLPTDGSLSDAHRSQIVEAVRAHVKEHGLTQAEVARGIGKSTTTVSELLSHSYKGQADPILRQLNQWMEDDERRRRNGRPIGFFPTSVFQSIRVLANYVKSNARTGKQRPGGEIRSEGPRIGVGYAPAGCGKSIGAAALHADEPSSILIRVEELAGSAVGISALIAAELGGEVCGRASKNMAFIKDRLMNSGRLLIVDEAHRLAVSGCEVLRDLADVCGIPILLLGTQLISDRLTRIRTGAGNMVYDQFSSRVGMVIDLARGADGAGGTSRPIFSIDEVRAIFKSNEVGLTRDAVDFLQAIACCVGVGMLRMAYTIWEKAFRTATKKRRPLIDEELLRECARYTLLPMGVDVPALMSRIDSAMLANKEIRVRAAG